MKFIRNIFDNLRPNFEKGGKLEKYYKAFEAMETFAFTPGHVTHHGAHVRDAIDLKRTMFIVVIALLPALLFGIWNTGHQHFLAVGEFAGLGEGFWEKVMYGAMKVLPLVVVSYAVGLGVEFVFAIVKNHSVNEGYLVSGMLIPLTLPVEVPLWMVAVATVFAVVIGKEVFGGTGMNVLNPALTARAFLFFAYPTKMSGNAVWISTGGQATVDGFTGATALGDAASKMPIDQLTAKYSLMDSFFGWIPGSIGETSALAILIGAALLIATGIGSWRVMLSMLLGGLAMGYLLNAFATPETPYLQLSPWHHLLLGGFLFGTVFMATDPVTAAQTNMGKWIYGFLTGVLAIIIRVLNPAYPEGVMLAILFMNVCAPLIDHYVIQANINQRLKRVKIKAA